MPKGKIIRCPYYITRSRPDKKSATITCFNIENNLGFDIKNQISFTCHEEAKNYVEIFCADLYETCPYYKALYNYNEEEK